MAPEAWRLAVKSHTPNAPLPAPRAQLNNIMIKNYFTIAIRYLRRHRVFSFINIAGLGLGMACCLFIYLFVQDELSYDRFHEKADRIYQVSYHAPNNYTFARIPPPLGPRLREYFPEVETSARMYGRNLSVRVPVNVSENTFNDFEEEDVFFVDSTLFNIFSFDFIAGTPNENLSDPATAIIAESMAEKYFGADWQKNNVLEQTLTFIGEHPFKIVGVVKDMPSNSHWQFHILVPYENMFTIENPDMGQIMRDNLARNWVISHSFTYVLLKEGASPAAVDEKMPALLEEHVPKELKVGQTFSLLPLLDVHLTPDVYLQPEPTSDLEYVYIFAAIAFVTLLIACFNFINLSTAQSLKRAREVGMRKVLGARKPQLFMQFLGESLLLSFVGFILALFIVFTALPDFNTLTEKSITSDYLFNWKILGGFLIIFVITGLLGGSYPAFYITRMKTLATLKGGKGEVAHKKFPFRKVLVVFQFAMSIALIAGAAIIFSQIRYMQNRPLGFQQEAIITIPVFSQNMNNVFGGVNGQVRSRLNAFENEVQQNSEIEAVTLSSTVPGLGSMARGTLYEGHGEEEGRLFIPTISVDYNFLDTYELELVAGRDFSKESGTDHTSAFIVNETSVKEFGWETPEKAIGKTIDLEGKKGSVIGVIKDFHYVSLQVPIGSLILDVGVPLFNVFSIKMNTQNFDNTLAFLEEKWATHFPEKTFEYTFLDNNLVEIYRADRRFGKIIGIFASLAILVSCLGTYGLSLLYAQQKEKEVGIRKVLGASVAHIISLLSKGHLILIGLASIIGIPLAYWGTQRWLENFAYRMDLSAGLFILSVGAVLLIALMTISYQTLKAALANPVHALRDE